MNTVLTNATVLDVTSGELLPDRYVGFEDGVIKEIAEGPPGAGWERTIDLRGLVVLPGLIDAHVHPLITTMDLAALQRRPFMVRAQETRLVLENMLRRGFTTVRDTGGGDYGVAAAIEQNLIRGPRLIFGGRALSQTAGHGDQRARHEEETALCACQVHSSWFSHVADGVDAVRKAAREELRRGAHHIKLMASGGVASPADPFWSVQYSPEEMAAIVGAAVDWGTYAAAHAYSPAAIARAVLAGVRTIEHGNMIDAPTAKLMAERGAFLVPTLVTYRAMEELGERLHLPPASQEKNRGVLEAGLHSIGVASAAGVRMGFGTDLLGETHDMLGREFVIRGALQKPIEVLRSATLINADIIRREGELGVLRPGAMADIIAVDGNPLDDLSLLASPTGEHVRLVIKGGEIFVNAAG